MCGLLRQRWAAGGGLPSQRPAPDDPAPPALARLLRDFLSTQLSAVAETPGMVAGLAELLGQIHALTFARR